jgi:cytochrome c oxidase subunit 2
MWTAPANTQLRELLLTLLGYLTRPTLRRVLWSALPAIAVAGLALFVAACAGADQVTNITNPNQPSIFPPTPVTEQASGTRSLYVITLIIALVVFVIVEGLLIIMALRFRRKSTDVELPKQTHGSNPLEILWTLVPAITVTFLFGAAIITLDNQERLSANPAVVVDVQGFQWQWTFKYPNQGNLSFTGAGTTGPEMVVPTNELIRIRLHSDDVIHSFYVPLFNYKLDVIPGRTNEFEVTVEEPGTYGGQCAEFCGLQHANMFFTVRAVSRAEFDAWVTQQQQAASATPAPLPSGGQTITLNAVNTTTFDPAALTAKANVPIVFEFHNLDPANPHNVAIEKATPQGTWAGTPIAQPGQTATYAAPPLAPGSYTFFCVVHPDTMRGTLTVQP